MVEKCRISVNSTVKIIKRQESTLACFLLNLVKASTMEHTRICNYSLSLIGNAFSRFSSLHPCSIGSWAQLDREKLCKHFYYGNNELELSNCKGVTSLSLIALKDLEISKTTMV